MTNLNLRKIAKLGWIKHWVGYWALLNDFYLGWQYTFGLKKKLGQGLNLAAFVSRKGYSTAYLQMDDWRKFGNFLALKVKRNPKVVDVWCANLKLQADKILRLLGNLKSSRVNATGYRNFLRAFYDYGVPHRAVKVVVDFLPPESLKKYLKKLTEARVHAEPVYAETENFMRFTASQISKQTGILKEHVLYSTKEEFEKFWRTGQLPKASVLKKRYDSSGILYSKGRYRILTGPRVNQFERALEKQPTGTGVLKGSSAFPGRARGRIRVVLDPQSATKLFKKGEILVTGMTRPEYLPLIRKCAAFVTDAGGMLSHAAITARELEKPCVVGTMVATKIFKTGDLVEVDATAGRIRKFKS
ncbi:MAG: hypothetical protein HY397_00545 [Candidatus Doudnabacteria bacterium]|nr:hypothetical protein [Candidatus Doudnabacteria bacterium]